MFSSHTLANSESLCPICQLDAKHVEHPEVPELASDGTQPLEKPASPFLGEGDLGDLWPLAWPSIWLVFLLC